MKKLFKILLKVALVLAVLGVAGLITLRLMFPPEKVKTLALDYAKNTLHREMSFDKLSFNLIGVTLDNFALSESATFKEGTFVKADKLIVKVALLPLLKKRVEISTIEIDGLDVNIVKQKDGAFNFDSLLSSSTAPAEETTENTAPAEKNTESQNSSSLVLLAENISIKDCNFYYNDLQTGTKTDVEDLNIEILHFDLASPFNTVISFTTAFDQEGGISISVPVTLDFTASLANLDMSKAYVKVNKISADYKTVQFLLKGDVTNFKTPQANLTGSLSGINNAVLSELVPDLPNFTLPVINLTLKAGADLATSSAEISQASLSVQDSGLKVSGKLNWGGESPTYNLSANLKTNLSQIVQMTDTIGDFKPAGQIAGSFKATEKKQNKDISGTVTLKDVSVFYAPFTANSLNGTIKITSLDDISCDSFTGLLNGEKFTSSFSYKNVKEVMNLVLNLDLAGLKMDAFPSQDSAQEETDSTEGKGQETTAHSKPEQNTETFMNVKANIKVGSVQVPYFRTDGFSIQADLSQISSSMTKTNGNVSFMLQPGAITNLDSFVKENKIVKILLLPITLVRKVAGMLNIELFPAENENKKGEITFTSGEGAYSFTNGLMTLDKTSFISKVTNLNGSGNINFANQALDMKVSATVLTSQTPIVIKIGGTMDNPTGKLDVVNTVTSLVGGILNYKTPGKVLTGTAETATSVTKGVATTATDTVKSTVDAAKDTLKSIGGLFKKKSDTQTENK